MVAIGISYMLICCFRIRSRRRSSGPSYSSSFTGGGAVGAWVARLGADSGADGWTVLSGSWELPLMGWGSFIRDWGGHTLEIGIRSPVKVGDSRVAPGPKEPRR